MVTTFLCLSCSFRWGYDGTQLLVQGQTKRLSKSATLLSDGDRVTMSVDFASSRLRFYRNGITIRSPHNVEPYAPSLTFLLAHLNVHIKEHALPRLKTRQRSTAAKPFTLASLSRHEPMVR
jgi:hypothetical protein